MRVTRRDLLRLGGAGAAGALLSACAGPGATPVNTRPTIPPADGPITLTYWSWLKDLQKVCDVWNAQNPHIRVEASWIPGGNDGGYQKMYSALAAGGGPDIGQVEMRTVPEFVLVDGLVDLRRYGVDQYADRFNETLWQQVSFVGGVYGIPQDSGPLALYYRPDLFQAAGAEVPATWEEWNETARRMRATDVYLECLDLSDTSWFAALAQQAGARWLRVEGEEWVIHMTDDATLQVARHFDRAIDEDLITTAYGQFSTPWYAAASAGQIASAAQASWGDALLQSVTSGAGQWRVAPLPTWGSGGYASTFLGGSTAAVLANSKHPQEAMEFAIWMTTSQEGIDAMIANSGIGWSPSRDYIGQSRLGGADFFGGQSYNTEVFEPAAQPEAQNPDWSWWPITQQSFNILSDGFRQKVSGGTLVDAIATAENAIVKAFTNKGLSIRKAEA
ncbi:extracellular solute-binding protein [Desertihabitans brevis]|uniref:Extracellular solute-binding protein n=1 Tax=Desertihabitans brevis TaxID=2268447 RepID=A0A367YVE7_9ACTN|nr:extracellular solute-binding protein [Desertihabitans brevis]RCK69737.1 extracellular solute-binding protein [Desertihabitans brevis]